MNSLPWLEKYINQNHHLPEIASAKQMQADGLNLGDNQIKLLQKVEELTLYLIEMKRQNEQLKAEQRLFFLSVNKKLSAQKKKNKALEKDMKRLLKKSVQKHVDPR